MLKKNHTSQHARFTPPDPNAAAIRYRDGQVHAAKGDYLEAVKAYRDAVLLNPEATTYKVKFAEMSRFVAFTQLFQDHDATAEALAICLADSGVMHILIADAWLHYFLSKPDCLYLSQFLEKNPLAPKSLIDPVPLLNDGMLLLGLRNLHIRSVDFEKLMTGLRRHFLMANESERMPCLPFLCALAEQCQLNDYAFMVTERESEVVSEVKSKLKANDLTAVALVGCYEPLADLEGAEAISVTAKESEHDCFARLAKTLIDDVLKVRATKSKIPTLSPIEDNVSNAVRGQYEENPFPRWRNVGISGLTDDQIRMGEGKHILIAGCGTGQEAAIKALQFPRARITAIDLSMASLAYGKVKAEEFGIRNIEWLQADILKVGELEKQFDMISSCGVLHHMDDPVEGWRGLVDILKPDGAMQVALYSERARQDVVRCRKYITDKGYEPTQHDMRTFRQDVMNLSAGNPVKAITGRLDFFSLSECRDLVFHAREHRFSPLQLKDILAELDLHLTALSGISELHKEKYLEQFPDDPNTLNLSNWDLYERDHPGTFSSMYTFWCRKNDCENPQEIPDWIRNIMVI